MVRNTVRLTPEAVAELHEQMAALIRQAMERSAKEDQDDARSVRVLYTLVDLQDRNRSATCPPEVGRTTRRRKRTSCRQTRTSGERAT